MNRQLVMILGGAAVVALLVAAVVSAKLSGGTKAPTTQILVAARKMAVGEKIKPEDVRWQPWPDAALFRGMIKKVDQKDLKKLTVYDAPLRRAVEAGEPVTDQIVILGKGGGNFLAASIAPGMRAASISVKPETAVAGFLTPGDFVDVILSYAPTVSGDLRDYSGALVQKFASETVLSNVKVLAVDQEAKDQNREAKAAKTITLEVSKEGAQVLALADRMGDISLSLRRMGEEDTPADRKKALTTDVSTSEVLRRLAGAAARGKTSSETVRVYRGAEIENVPVRPTDAR